SRAPTTQPHPLDPGNDYTGQQPTTRQSVFSFNDPATTEIYTLSLHDALPIFRDGGAAAAARAHARPRVRRRSRTQRRSEEHTSELQSRQYLVCRLLLEKK